VKVVALSGGVGGARLVEGLGAVLPPDDLTVVVNTGDDFIHWGLHICPDLDTVMYTLAGLAHPEQGWGLAGETFHAFAMVERYGGEAWFRLGDRDLATHLVRTQAAMAGKSLTAITAELCRGLGVGQRVLPMSDAPCPTMIETAEGTLSFQDWLVRRRARLPVVRVLSAGSRLPAPGVLESTAAADVVVIGPSNPYVSIDPILGQGGIRPALAARKVVAVSPIVGGKAVKGPLAGMIETLAGRPASAVAIRDHYGDLLRGFVLEEGDEAPADLPVLRTGTVIPDATSRARLAREVLEFARGLA
jgi:LPPG:FO 2-phospho-L-lactate transferase